MLTLAALEYTVVPRARGDALAVTACAMYAATLSLLGEEGERGSSGTSRGFVRVTAERNMRGLEGVERGGGVVERGGRGSGGDEKEMLGELADGLGCLLILPVTKDELEDTEGLAARVRVVGALVGCTGDVGGERGSKGMEGEAGEGEGEGEGDRDECFRGGVSLEKLELGELVIDESRKRREPILGLLPWDGGR